MPEAYIYDHVRTPRGRGKADGALHEVTAVALATVPLQALRERNNLKQDVVDDVILGVVDPVGEAGSDIARFAAMNAGLGEAVPGVQISRFCASGLDAVNFAAAQIMSGQHNLVIGGGAESMSRGPYVAPTSRWGARMGDAKIIDMMVGALHDPFNVIHMGVTAENVAAKFGITRGDQDALAVESHRRASAASKAGYFKDQIVPIELKSRKGTVLFDTDEHIRHDATLEDMAKLKPVFLKENGTVTAGNASGINDAAAALVLMERKAAEKAGLKPLARLVSYGHAGVDPKIMGIGPVPASRKALERAGIGIDKLDVIESNEAFAAQACAVVRELGLDPKKVNPNGSGISLGHPIGATGAIITTKALYELQRTGGRYALVTMCIGGGQGIAAVFERIG